MDRTTEYLVFGFIRNIKIKNQIIPSSIIELCIEFYFHNITILYIQQSTTKDHPKISMNLDQQKYHIFKIEPLYKFTSKNLVS